MSKVGEMLIDETKKEVIILGTGQSSNKCPFDCETWSCNGGYKLNYLPNFRLDRLFISDTLYDPNNGELNFDISAMNDLGIPIMSLQHIKGLNYIPYPLKEVEQKFTTNYFTCTLCYMLAFALLKDYNWIHLFGVDFPLHSEYVLEKPGIEFWLGLAKGRRCNISHSSSLLQTHNNIPYGFLSKEEYFKCRGGSYKIC